jgi:hypothetical protein
MTVRLVVVCSLLLAALFGTAACGGDITLPKPAPMRVQVHRESDDWIKPGTKVILRGGIGAPNGSTFRVFNSDTFTWTLLDDIWLFVLSPNGQGTVHGNPSYVYLRCPAPRTIAPGANIEISTDDCRATTDQPGPGATITGFRIVAKEGGREAGMDVGIPLVRRQKDLNQRK